MFSALVDQLERHASGGRISDSSARPTVVSTSLIVRYALPSSSNSFSLMRTLTVACSSATSVVVGAVHLVDVGKHHAFALGVDYVSRVM